mgnify:FL=1
MQADVQAAESELTEASEAYSRAMHSALRMLAAREHSVQELHRKLTAKGHNARQIAQVLDELRAQNLQSDARFAEGYVRARSAKGFGPMRIRQGLFERGINDELVDTYLTHGAEHWLSLAEHALVKRFKSSDATDHQEWNRRARFLAGRGFPADIIYRTLGER